MKPSREKMEEEEAREWEELSDSRYLTESSPFFFETSAAVFVVEIANNEHERNSLGENWKRGKENEALKERRIEVDDREPESKSLPSCLGANFEPRELTFTRAIWKVL